VCALGYYSNTHYVQSSTYGHVISVLFPCHSKISSSILDPRLFETVVTEFVGSLISDTSCSCKNLEVKYEDNT